LVFLVAALLLPAPLLASQGEGGHSVITNIALCMVTASVMGLLMKWARQPLILAYVLAGVIIGPVGFRLIASDVEVTTISEVGLILLLFMIGLEIDLRKMLDAGRLVILTGILQFPICAGLAYLAFWLLESAGISTGSGLARLYCAVAVSLSSTMIVIKLLYDKLELDTLPGRITVGVLVFQDIWAIVVLAVQPNIADPHVVGLLRTFGAGAMLVVAALAMSRYVLPRLFRAVAKLPELLLVLSLGWCFLVCLVAAHPAVGLSMEMGALIAGISLATFPYNLDVIGKVVTIRDFFITLFFVALGMQIPVPETQVIVVALAIAGVALAVRVFGVFGVLYAMGAGHRASLLATINLSQVSEFSLVIVALGVGLKHLDAGTLTYVVWVFALLAVGSTYLVTYSHPLQGALSRVLKAVGVKDVGQSSGAGGKPRHTPIVLLGFFRVASALLHELALRHQHLVQLVKVVDFNPLVKKQLDSMGVSYVYGDIGHRDTLHHADLHDAEVVICTVPDAFLKGTTNLDLLDAVRSLCPGAKVFLTAESPARAAELYAAGADYVIQPSALAGSALASLLEQAVHHSLEGVREEALADLAVRKEVLA
jgi:Kef-type K+ transport system membrane component KefB